MAPPPPGGLRLVPRLVQLIHRHGDRTPITKLNASERAFWRAQLPGKLAVSTYHRTNADSCVALQRQCSTCVRIRCIGSSSLHGVAGQLTLLEGEIRGR